MYHCIFLISRLMRWQLVSLCISKSVYRLFSTSFPNTVREPHHDSMIHLTEKSPILHLRKAHAQRCPQLVPTHRARLGWRCATLQWPRVSPQVYQVCPGSVAPKKCIKFFVGLNVGWTQIFSYHSYIHVILCDIISYYIMYILSNMTVNTLWNRMKANAISWNHYHLILFKVKVAILESRVLMMVKGSDDISSTWDIQKLKSPQPPARLRDVERWNPAPERHLTMRFTSSNSNGSVTYHLLLDFSQKDDIKRKMLSTTFCSPKCNATEFLWSIDLLWFMMIKALLPPLSPMSHASLDGLHIATLFGEWRATAYDACGTHSAAHATELELGVNLQCKNPEHSNFRGRTFWALMKRMVLDGILWNLEIK